jgi:hypothetical protein
MASNINLRIEPQNSDNESLLPVVGKLRYVADRSRPDILVAVGEVSSNGTPHPSDAHVRTAKRTISYLKTTAHESLWLGGKGEVKLFGFSDASYVTTGKCKSRLGG